MLIQYELELELGEYSSQTSVTTIEHTNLIANISIPSKFHNTLTHQPFIIKD